MDQHDVPPPPETQPPRPVESPQVAPELPVPRRHQGESLYRVFWRFWANRWLRLGLSAALVLLAVTPFAVPWTVYRFTHSITDDAFVQTHIVNIAPQEVSGHLVRYLVQEHDEVAAGQLLAEIDPLPYREQVALLQAKFDVTEAQLAEANASLALLEAQVPRDIEVAERALDAAKSEQVRDEQTLQFTTEDVDKAIHEAQSELESARASLDLAEKDHTRYVMLFAKGAGTERQSQDATRTYQVSQAEVKASEARLGRALAAQKKVEAVRQAAEAAGHQAKKAEQALALARTRYLEITQAERLVETRQQLVGEARRALDVAKTSLRYTRIVAPFPGVVVYLYRHLGDHVPAGTPVLSLYNPELTYVEANLEETKLPGVAPGNQVRIDIDAFRQPFRGRVVWINKATGANFALVPRNISSGEFTKVVQRVPVRILVEKDERWPQLHAGLSVTVAIAHGPGDPEWAGLAADALRELEASVKPSED